MDPSTLELRLQQVARQMGTRSSSGAQQGMGNSNMQSGLPPGMVPNPGQQSSHITNASSGMQFQGQPGGMPTGPMPGFMPTPNLPQSYSTEDASMRGGVGNGSIPFAGSSPMDGGINGMVPTSNQYPPSGMVPTPMMRTNGQRDNGFMGGQLLNVSQACMHGIDQARQSWTSRHILRVFHDTGGWSRSRVVTAYAYEWYVLFFRACMNMVLF